MTDKETELSGKLRRGNYAYLTEAAARNIARSEFADFEILIVHSPHDANPSVKGHRMDYWIDEPNIVRSWERVLFEGLGRNA